MAIIDVGKTNKKLFLFDQQYRIVWERTETLAETVDEDGDPCEDLARLTHWTRTAVAEVLALPQFSVQALNISTYGASLVAINEEGRSFGALYNYLKPLPPSLREQFMTHYGPADHLSLATASPILDSLNAGLMLYRIKWTKPRFFRRIWYVLHLPQYLSYLFTAQPLTDLTSLGCHTLLWDFNRQTYHEWVKTEGFVPLMGSLFPGDRTMPALFSPRNQADQLLKVGVGLHDSSAALIPYLATFKDPFVLISTGTWCISLNPFTAIDGSQPLLTAEELQYDCLCYMTYQGKPVKASRLFAGHEHEQQIQRLASHFGVSPDYYKQVRYNPSTMEQLTESPPLSVQGDGMVPPASMPSPHTSAFGRRVLADFPDYETAYHQLMLDIMAGQLVSTVLVMPTGADIDQPAIVRIFVDGGFSQNSIYMNLLATAFPQTEVWAALVAQATALGAALAIHDDWNPLPRPSNLITLTRYITPKPVPA